MPGRLSKPNPNPAVDSGRDGLSGQAADWPPDPVDGSSALEEDRQLGDLDILGHRAVEDQLEAESVGVVRVARVGFFALIPGGFLEQ